MKSVSATRCGGRSNIRATSSSAPPPGQEGLALIDRDPPDLVFLDIKMPGMDGLEVLEHIKARTPCSPRRDGVGSRHGAKRLRGARQGRVGFIEKPFSEPVLLERIEKELAGNRTRHGVSGAAAGSRLEVSDGRQQRGAAEGGRGHPQGRADARHGAAARRERRRQGARRAHDSSPEPAQPRALRAGELRRDS